ncbi:hypothetical protein PR202_gb14629 [Eleusine coracana subsp. coracana]|uniref:Cytochrome P450 704C1 n=1 Tax=Eleusine coracana subsp. coracana TaxID=191504 RepID=A0AAV5EW46_ELECO|nr:hypothetical protein PR202_gb14629 [Eleusine coracana subsp. coracana]
MGRMKFLWGKDAEEFRPERWLDDDGVFVPESPFKFTAFQAGPRICLGKEFAYRQMKILAAVLLNQFRFQMLDSNCTMGYRLMLTLKMEGPIPHTAVRGRAAGGRLSPGRQGSRRESMDSLPGHPALIALSLLLLLALYLARLRRGGSKHRKYPPVAGTMIHQLLNFNRLAEYMTELSHRYRTFRMLTPTCNYVYTVEPANVEYILKTNFANYGKGVMTHDVLEDLLGDGIFNVDGAKWRHQRKAASLEFSTRILREYSSAVFRDTAAELAGVVNVAARDGERVDMVDLLMRSTLDTIFRVAFGVSLGSLSGSSGEGAAFARAFDDASEGVLYRFFDPFWKAKRLLNVSSEAALKRSVRVIDGFVYAIIDRKIEQMGRDQQEFAKKEDILSRFLLEREHDPGCFDNKYLRDIILNFVIAGRDTTAGTLSWFLYALCKNERVQHRIAREVRAATTGDRNDVGIHEFVACLTEDAISKMQYLHAALTETLRLYPGVPLDVKYCFSDDTLPDGYAVKKGDMVNYTPFPMGRMKFLWGADAEEFRPERWLDDDGVFVPESPFKFTAFQAGPRICLGKEFAYRQMKIFAAVLLYFFKFEMWERNATVGFRPMLTLKMDGPLHVRASLRH